MKFLLFDIDGTLIYSGGAGARALDRAFESLYGIKEAMSVVNPHGQTDIMIVEEIFQKKLGRNPRPGEVERVIDQYLIYLEEEVNRAEKYRILPRVVETLETLSRNPNVAMGLATGNVEKGARIKLERGNLNRFFPFGGFGSDHRERWQIVRIALERGMGYFKREPSEVYVIGDTPLDILAGKRAGFKTVGVATSIYSREDLEKSGADFVFENLGGILEIIN